MLKLKDLQNEEKVFYTMSSFGERSGKILIYRNEFALVDDDLGLHVGLDSTKDLKKYKIRKQGYVG